jgi:hypothetical protein
MQDVMVIHSLSIDEIVELPNGQSVRCISSPDEFTDINDDEFFGRLEWVRKSSNLYGDNRTTRPDWCDGNAEIIDREHFSVLWWQPSSDAKRGTDEFTRLRRSLMDIVNYGYQVITLELREGTDAYGRPIVIDVESEMGVEAMADDGDIREITRNLFDEMMSRQN